ncbi:hypothetical protein Y032_0164g3562 [Ancylostoma ceylanicum]|uniref:Uncharacterized protein n=1 Tax=Ancylostoma ceylanicum TaxID=53326 RepID=A0A016SWM6_9BILA|nr:hypothetical protein Y032_0164g3562 [Ancylostoma ceylanicum]
MCSEVQLISQEVALVISEAEERNLSLKRPCLGPSEDVAKKPHLDAAVTVDPREPPSLSRFLFSPVNICAPKYIDYLGYDGNRD